MNFIDLHCDALTKEGVAVVSEETLRAAGVKLQCFAAFVNGEKGEGFSRFFSLADKFEKLCERGDLHPVQEQFSLSEGGNAMLTVEGGEAIEELSHLDEMKRRGVKMIGITWNRPNALGFPHGEKGGSTEFGKACVEKMCDLKILPDVAHGSDELVGDVAEICKGRGMPFVCSHAGARAVFPCSRNLSDESIRKIAEGGGVVGVYFVAKFLSKDRSAEGQREAIFAHIEHIRKVGGEDVLALGSDFDGAPPNPYIKTPADLKKLAAGVYSRFSYRFAEKFFFRNALRVLGG